MRAIDSKNGKISHEYSQLRKQQAECARIAHSSTFVAILPFSAHRKPVETGKATSRASEGRGSR